MSRDQIDHLLKENALVSFYDLVSELIQIYNE